MGKLDLKNSEVSSVAGPKASRLGMAGGAVIAALVGAYSDKANAFDAVQDLDAAVAGSRYSAVGTARGFAGIPGGDSYVTVISGHTASTYHTDNAVDFVDVTSDIQALDPALSSAQFIVEGYAPDKDAACIYAMSDGSYRIDNFSAGVAGWTLTPVSSSGYCSVDNTTGDTIVTVDNGAPTEHDIVDDTTGINVLATTAEEANGISDSANDRVGYYDSTSSFSIWNTASGANEATLATGTTPLEYIPAAYSPTGEGMWIANDFATGSLTYYGDGTTATVDADGDGSISTADCNDANASIYPGAADGTNDGVDQDCVNSAPQVSASSIPGSATQGDTVDLSLTAVDAENMPADLTISWVVTSPSGVNVSVPDGASASFEATDVGTYTVVGTVTDTDGLAAPSVSGSVVVSAIPDTGDTGTPPDSGDTGGEVACSTSTGEQISPVILCTEGGSGEITSGDAEIVDGVIVLDEDGDAVSVTSTDETNPAIVMIDAEGFYGYTVETYGKDDIDLGVDDGGGTESAFAPPSGTQTPLYLNINCTEGRAVVRDESGAIVQTFTPETGKGSVTLVSKPTDTGTIDTAGGDTDTDSDADADTDADADADTDTDVDADTEPVNRDTGVNDPKGCTSAATALPSTPSSIAGFMALGLAYLRRRASSKK